MADANRKTRNMRLTESAHQVIDKKLAKVNIRRVKQGKKQLSKGDVAADHFGKVTLKYMESL